MQTKKTTLILAATIAMTWTMQGVADHHEKGENQKLAIHHIHVKMGHGVHFKAGMEAYSACLAESGYEDSYSVWQAVDGDRTGYHIVSSFDMWAEFDEEDEASSACWKKEGMRDGIFDHMASWKTSYAKRMADWSGSADGYSIVKLHNFSVEDGSEFRSLVSEMTGHLKKAKYEHMGTWYDVLGSGHKGADYFVVEHFENYAAMDEDRKGVSGVLKDAVGEEQAEQFWEKFGETLADENGYWSNLLQRQDSMGYSPDED